MRRLHGQGHANTEGGEGNHRRGPNPDEHHLAKNRRDLEELAAEGRDQQPVQQIEIKLDVVLQRRLSSILAETSNEQSSISLRDNLRKRPQLSLSLQNTFRSSRPASLRESRSLEAEVAGA